MKDSRYRILWKGQITGPFTRDQVEAMLAKNEIGVWAEISEGNSGWKPISEWRIRKPAFKAAPKVESRGSEANIPPKLNVAPTAPKRPDVPDLPPLPDPQENQSDQPNSFSSYRELDNVIPLNGTSPSGFFYWAFLPFKKYGVFTGRARRKEYWLFTLFNLLMYFLLGFVEGALEIAPEIEESLLAGCYGLLVIIPGWAVTVRRLHDTNRSGWWTLLVFTGIGSLVLLLFNVQEGTDGENGYGPDSK